MDSWLRGYMFRKRQDRWESFNFNVVRSYEVSRHQLINSSWSHQERGEEISLAAEIADVFFMAFKDTSTMASWGLIIGKSLSEGLEVTFKMSYALGYTVRLITIRHQQVLTKSGIISSDPATKAPEIRWVKVVEQALVGIPLWLLDLPSRLPKIPYFIFPGSVGDNKALAGVLKSWVCLFWLSSTKEPLLDTERNGCVVGALNVYNLGWFEAVVTTVEEEQNPVILQTYPRYFKTRRNSLGCMLYCCCCISWCPHHCSLWSWKFQ